MSDVNNVVIQGRLTRDPELTHTANGAAICKLGLATNRFYKSNDEKQEEVSFFDVTVFGAQGENCEKYLEKGRRVIVQGRAKQDRWTNDKGEKRTKVVIIANSVTFLDWGDKKEEGESGEVQVPF